MASRKATKEESAKAEKAIAESIKKEEEKRAAEFILSEASVNEIDNFYKASLNAHAQGVLNYENAFFKSLEMIKNSLVRREV